MPAVSRNIGIREFQSFISQVYGLPNDRHFELAEMHGNIQRFAMRGLKGIRQAGIERGAIVIDGRDFSVHRAPRAHHLAPKHLADALMAETDA